MTESKPSAMLVVRVTWVHVQREELDEGLHRRDSTGDYIEIGIKRVHLINF